MRRLFSQERVGSTLLVVLFLLIVLLMVAGSIGTLSNSTIQSVNKDYWESRARYASKAGVQHALSRLREDNNYNLDIVDEPMKDDPSLVYTVDIENNLAGPDRYAPDGVTWLPAGTIWVYSIGRLSDREESGTAGYAAIVGAQRPSFDDAAFGLSNVRIETGGKVIMAGKTRTDPPAPDDKARIATFNNAPGSITLNNALVHGEIRPGVGAGATAVNAIGSQTGSIAVQEDAKVVSPLIIPDIPNLGAQPDDPDVEVTSSAHITYLQPGTYNNLTVANGAQLFLQPDANTSEGTTYRIKGDLIVSAGSLSIPEGQDQNPVKIYVEGDVRFIDAVVNGGNLAGDAKPVMLQIYQTGQAAAGVPGSKLFRVETTPGGNTFCQFVAAGADTRFELDQRAVMVGSVIANDVLISNDAELHYDPELRGVLTDGNSELGLISATEIPTAVAQNAANNVTATTGPPPPPPPAPPPAPPEPTNNAATTGSVGAAAPTVTTAPITVATSTSGDAVPVTSAPTATTATAAPAPAPATATTTFNPVLDGCATTTAQIMCP